MAEGFFEHVTSLPFVAKFLAFYVVLLLVTIPIRKWLRSKR